MWEVPRTRPRRVKYDDAAAFLALRFTKYSDFFFFLLLLLPLLLLLLLLSPSRLKSNKVDVDDA